MSPRKTPDRLSRPRPALYLREWRKHRGLTQEDFSERMGMSRTHYSRIESKRLPWDQPFLGLAAEMLGCKPVDLLMRDPTNSAHEIWAVVHEMDDGEKRQASAVLRMIKGDKG